MAERLIPLKIFSKRIHLLDFSIYICVLVLFYNYKSMSLTKIFLYRITHIDNIPFILENGITHKNSVKANPNYINIGDVSLIDTRRDRRISITNGERDFGNIDSVVLGEYIPFYFGSRMPMLYVIQKGGNFVTRATSPAKIIYIVCRLTDVVKSGIEYIFSDGHATDNFTTFYDATKISTIERIIDFQSVKAVKWSGEGVPLDLKRKKQAEFLIKEDVSPDLIAGFICYNENAGNELEILGIEKSRIKILPSAYY